MKRCLLLGVLCCASLLVSCTPRYTREKTQEVLADTRLVEYQQVRRENTWVLPQSAKLFIAYPHMGQADQSRRLNRTQHTLAELLKNGFGRYFPATIHSLDEQALSEALSDARRRTQDFLIFPELLAISQNPAAASKDTRPGLTAKNNLDFNLRIYDVRSRKLVDTIKVTGGQGWLDFSTQEPQVLMEKSIDAAVKTLAGG